ncbi:helix-hairpin-helix domain-containing protein [Spirillospora sp. NPDC050679]
MKLHDRLRRPTPFGGGAPLGPPRDVPPAAHLRAAPDPPDRVRIPAAEGGGLRLPSTEELDPGPRGVRTLIAIGVIAAVAAAAYFWLARPTPEAAPPPPSAQPAAVAEPRPAQPLPSPSPSASVTVHVFGKVERPGIVSLPAGARVADAIKAAGGPRPTATTGALNLARKLQDGEQIPVGVPAPTPPPGQPPPGAAPSAAAGSPVDLNTATTEELDALPGVGPVLAQRIVEYRTQHGGFRSVEQLQEVTGIGARRFADLKAMVRV